MFLCSQWGLPCLSRRNHCKTFFLLPTGQAQASQEWVNAGHKRLQELLEQLAQVDISTWK